MASEDWDAELLYGHGGADVDFDVEMLRSAVKTALDKITKPVETVLIVPPVRPPAAAVLPRRRRDRGGRRGFCAPAERSNKLLLRQDFTAAAVLRRYSSYIYTRIPLPTYNSTAPRAKKRER